MKELEDYQIDVKSIRPLSNGKSFAANVERFSVRTTEGTKEIVKSLGEVYGETSQEAEQKAVEQIRNWLKSNEV